MSLSIHEIECCPASFLSGLYDMSNVCKGCGKSEFIDDEQTGDRICVSCGEVQLSNLLSEKPDWRSFKEDENAEDDAHADTFTDSILKNGTLSTDFIFDGRTIDAKQKAMMKRVENPKEARRARKFMSIHSAIEEAGGHLGLSSGVIRCAFDLYSDCSSLMHIRGKRSEIIVSACLYLACRIMKCYRLLSEIVSILLADLRKTARLSQVIISELKLVIDPPTDADYIGRYCSVLLLPRSVYDMALRVLDSIKEGNYPNVSGSALNAVVVLMASRICDMQDPPSTEQMAVVAMKSEQSVIRLYKTVYTHCDSILVTVFRDDAGMKAKSIMKIAQKLEPKRL